MPIRLSASTELVDVIGPERFEDYLKAFNATVVGRSLADMGLRTIYTLDIPDAPEGAARVEPLYGARYHGGKATPYLIRLDWYDAAGRLIHPQPPAP